MSKDGYGIKLGQILLLILGVLIVYKGGYFCYKRLTDRVVTVTSELDGKNYVIRSNSPTDNKENHIDLEKLETANYLATISDKVNTLVNYMVRNNLPDNETAIRLMDRWKDCKFRETSSTETTAAYTVNKGDEMRLCVRTKDGLENMNTSMFVVLHELGHLMSVSYGHNEEFRNNFSYIVHLASSLGIYKPEDFGNSPTSYCGTEINTTPCMSGTCEYNISEPVEQPFGQPFGNTRGLVNF
jgi:hypothetical protein